MDTSWLDQELEELDQAEKFIQETMSNFVPTPNKYNTASQETTQTAPPVVRSGPSGDVKPAPVTSTLPRAEIEVDKLTSQLIEGLSNGKKDKSDSYQGFDLPPPPDLDDFITSVPSQEAPKSPDLPPPPKLNGNYKPTPPPVQPKKKQPPPVMSKPTAGPPPVMPKPSRSAPLKSTHTGINTVSFQVNQPSSKPEVAPKSERPAVGPGSEEIKPAPKASVEDELDYVTRTLFEGMDNPKDEDMYGFCAKCNGVVEGEKVGCQAMDQIWHIKCFNCTSCQTPLHGEQFFAVKNKPWCQECYTNSLDKCDVCSQTITDRILRATGKAYHPTCFTCTVCNKSLDGIPFTVDDNKLIFCVDDYHKKYAPKCSVCNERIMPEPGKEETIRIVALDRSFHVLCYKCELCGLKLTSEKDGNGCFPLDNRVLCKNCNAQLVQRIGA